ncbi:MULTISPECIES: UDP-N-acetylmuramoyl-tripeptide--D-alanyl-D-alanine ligase [Pontibacillus]|uniref:UDP-N-acetylmuramoyl-tripeptide--D-alanyl-D-alanine ligase n=1 Tax=Pontibacillus chungwhensis TaxID=265426 RepID=A0ABY8V2K3_9BACI|nr:MULTISPECIES: UDP-N-acetylmuramoyl-tripeptide--D-alanyl-D-alanine ligase [Pontibacillus]MCD5322589.1 UDP-N-acetylmuramoyl-tripeptide--D-alanyl-D-alanine ligase [Pontibacillus sp. HN14]WIF99873.1 UDP-N-acetylmuramoyl-tripeptide--D-alanyl-D-alanine ligase [Pontibacillus chungwhensis]
MNITTNWIHKHFPSARGVASETIEIRNVFTDTRKKTDKGLFVPIRGDRFDGHEFLKDAIEGGAVAALWDQSVEVPGFVPTDFPLFFVDDTIIGLQQLAHIYRKEINPKVIGVTGSNGKTTTKDFIAAVLAPSFETHKTSGNFNNHIGLPLTILSMPATTEVLVLEMGMNHFGEIENLSFIAEPDFAVITNIGESHIEFLGSREGIAQAKSEILAGLREGGTLLLDGDEPLLAPLHTREGVLSCGFDQKNKYVLSDIQMSGASTSFAINENESYTIHLLGKHNVKNASFAIKIGSLLGMDPSDIQKGLNEMTLTGMRFELIEGKNGAHIVNDAYNASPTSMRASIEVIKELNQYSRKILILGDIFELGAQSEEMHRSVAKAIDSSVDVLITVGDASSVIAEEVRSHHKDVDTYSFSSKEEAAALVQPMLQEGTIVLLKASRLMAFESFVEEFTE